MAVVMRAGLGVRLDRHGARPELLSPTRAKLIAALRSMPASRASSIQLVAGNDAHAVMLPAFRAIVRMRGVIVRFGHVVTKSLIALASGTPIIENHQQSLGARRYRQVLR